MKAIDAYIQDASYDGYFMLAERLLSCFVFPVTEVHMLFPSGIE